MAVLWCRQVRVRSFLRLQGADGLIIITISSIYLINVTLYIYPKFLEQPARYYH